MEQEEGLKLAKQSVSRADEGEQVGWIMLSSGTGGQIMAKVK